MSGEPNARGKKQLLSWRQAVIIALIINLHFVVSLIIDQRMQKEIFVKSAALAADIAQQAFESPLTSDADGAMRRINEELPSKTAELKEIIFDSWKPYSYLPAFPTEDILKGFWEEEINETWILQPYKDKEIGDEERFKRENLLVFFQKTVNSLAFGVLLCLLLSPFFYLMRQRKKKQNDNESLSHNAP
jgi:hypothetical protein